jgi:hypothetical protein
MKWNYESCRIEALKYSTKNELRNKNQGCYKAARKNGFLDQICYHMISGKLKWDKNKVIEAAKEFKNRIEFKKNKQGAYSAALKNGWLDEACAHMKEYVRETYWTKEKCREEAKNYNTRSEFNEKSRGAYSSAYNNNWLDEICIHMKKFHIEYNEESIRKEAIKYSSRTEFKAKNQAAYKKARALKVLDKVCIHMNVKKQKWTFEELQNVALKCEKRIDFQRNYPGAYAYAKRMNYLDEIFKSIKSLVVKWTFEECKKEASKYESINEFSKKSLGAYQAALKNKWLNQFEFKIPKKTFWTKELCKIEAKKYKSRVDFSKHNGSAYQYALKEKFLDEICEHMPILGNLYKRMIYAYEFPDKHVYVGLTYNEQKRKYEHLYEKKGPVSKHIEKTKQKPIYKKLSNFEEVEVAKKLEQSYINQYKSLGYKLLNRSKAGALGGNKTFWTKEECQKVANDFKRKRDFAKHPDYGGAYNAAIKHKWLDEICSHMTDGNIRWNKELCINEAKKYNSKTQFQKNSGGAYNYASRNKLLEEIYLLMKW